MRIYLLFVHFLKENVFIYLVSLSLKACKKERQISGRFPVQPLQVVKEALPHMMRESSLVTPFT